MPRYTYVNAGIFVIVMSAAVLIVVGTVLLIPAPGTGSGTVLKNDTVVARLQIPGAGYSPALQEILREARARPADIKAAKAAATALISEGRMTGDSRLVGAAAGVLISFLVKPDAETLLLIATARQYQHDFVGALSLLDQAIRLEPQNANALLTRATVQIVLGKFDLATADCQRIANLSRVELGFLCQSTALLLTKHASAVYLRLEGIVSNPTLLEPTLRRWAISLMGEISLLQGNSAAAKLHFADVIAGDPMALRERLLLTDILLDEKAAAAALALLEPAPDIDGVLIRRVLATKILGDSAIADPVIAELDRRFRLNIDLGLTAHAREETRYFLQISVDPKLALKRALVNWDLQHELEDAQLLIDAAMAANEPSAAVRVLAWMKEQTVDVPTLRVPDSVRRAAE